MTISYGPEIYGIRWGKFINDELVILYEQYNLFELDILKEKIKNSVDNKLAYFVLKSMFITNSEGVSSRPSWVECEKEVIITLK